MHLSTSAFRKFVGAHALLWHEYKHKDRIVLFEGLVAILCGERIDIRVLHKGNVSHRNTAPMFYTSNSRLRVIRDCPEEMPRLNQAMDERFLHAAVGAAHTDAEPHGRFSKVRPLLRFIPFGS